MAGQREIDFTPLDLPPGIFTLKTPVGAVRRWFDGLNVRWDDGKPQKMGGFLEHALYDQSAERTEYMGRARSYYEWQSLDGQTWIAFGTACKLYLIGGDTLYDITPMRRQAYITDGVATTDLSSIVTITDPGHDAQAGDHFSVEGGAAVNGITLSGEYEVLEVLDVDTFTVETGQTANATGSGGGTMTLRYDISCGLESDDYLYGYGVGPYGEGSYGTPRTESTYRGFARIWSFDNWGEDLIASPNGDTIYVWSRNTGPQSRAVAITGAPANVERIIIGPDNQHIIALGANLASTGIQDKMFIRWCVGRNYNDWTLTGTNDAGSKRLDYGSRLITAVKTNRQIMVWSDKMLYAISIIGGQAVYDTIPVATTPQLCSPNSVIDVDGTVYAMTENDFYIYDGTYRILECEIRNFVYGDENFAGINREQLSKVQCKLRRKFNEVRWSVPYGDSEENAIDIVYNYKEKCWYYSDVTRETGGDNVPFYGYPLGFSDGRMWLEENGVDAYNPGEDDPVALNSMLESWEGQIADGSAVTEISQLMPDMQWLIGSMIVSVFGRNYPQDLRDLGPDTEISAATQTIKPKFKRRQLGFRIETVDIGDTWRLGDWRGKYIPHGR